MPQQDKHNNEVDLLLFFNAVVKRKNIVIGAFLAFIFTAAVLTFLEPKLYIISEILEPPAPAVGSHIIMLRGLEKEIEDGNYIYSISDKLQSPAVRNFNLNATIYEETKHVKIEAIVKEKDVRLGLKTLDALFLILKSEYEPKMKTEKSRMEHEILCLKNEISKIKCTNKKMNLKNPKSKKQDVEIENNLNIIEEPEVEKQFIGNIAQIQVPISLPYDAKIGKIRKITAAAMLGLAAGVFLALILEFWQKFKANKRITD